MEFQIVSNKTLAQYSKNHNVLLIDLRSYDSYHKSHIPGALWMNWEHASEEIPLLLEHNYCMNRWYPDWIALYCHSGRISLRVARELSQMGYPILSLHGGYDRWEKEHSTNCLLEFQHTL